MRFGGSKAKTKTVQQDADSYDDADAAPVEEEAIQQPLTSSFLSGGGPGGPGGGAGGEADLDFSSLSEGSRLFSKGTLLVVLVLIVAAGSFYAMHLSQVDHSATDEQKRAEARIDQLMAQLKQTNGNQVTLTKAGIDAMFKDMDGVLKWLDNDRMKSQVPVEFTKRNPFSLLVDKPAATTDAPPKEDPEVKRLALLRAKLEAEVRTFKLQSVVPTGRTPVAIINNKILQVGGELGSFKIVEISNVTVTLESQGIQFTLSMETDPNRPNDKGVRRVGDK